MMASPGGSADDHPPKRPRLDGQFRWVQLARTNRISKIVLGTAVDIDDYRKNIKANFPRTLQHVDASDLEIFQSKAAFENPDKTVPVNQAFRAFKPISDIDGGTSGLDPLYVNYPDAPPDAPCSGSSIMKMREPVSLVTSSSFLKPYHGDCAKTMMDHIRNAIDNNTDVLPFAQSSGWGKTRFFFQVSMSQHAFLIYFHMQLGGNGYPHPEAYAKLVEVLSVRLVAYSTYVERVKAFILGAVKFTSDTANTPSECRNACYMIEKNDIQYTEAFKSHGEAETLGEADIDKLRVARKTWLIVFDEVAALGDTGMFTPPHADHSRYMAWRRAGAEVVSYLREKRVSALCVPVATTSALHTVTPLVDASTRVGINVGKLMTNFYQNFDVIARRDYEVTDLLDFKIVRHTRDDVDRLVKLGRPLWASYDPQTVATQARHKLQCGEGFNAKIAVAVVGACVCGYTCPLHLAADLVHFHMATADIYSEKHVLARYVSEPVLAEGAKQIVGTSTIKLCGLFDQLLSVYSQAPVHTGDIGEILICLVILDIVRVESEDACFPVVSAQKVIDKLVPKQMSRNFFNGYYLSINHFLRFPTDISATKQLPLAVCRCAGIIAAHGAAKLDLILPLFTIGENGKPLEIKPLVIQVKNRVTTTLPAETANGCSEGWPGIWVDYGRKTPFACTNHHWLVFGVTGIPFLEDDTLLKSAFERLAAVARQATPEGLKFFGQ